MVDNLAVTDVQLGNFRHVLVRELEVPDIHVLLDALLVDRLRDNHNAALYVPAQGNLSGALAVFLADGSQHRMGENAVISLRKRAPGFRHNAVLLHEGQRIFLLEEGMQLHLVDCRDDLDGLAQVSQTVWIEVAHADRLQLAFLVGFLHRAVGTDIVAHRLMNQVEIEVGKAQIVQRGLDGLLGGLIAGVLHPQLGGDKQLLARHTGFFDGLAHCLFVHVSGSGIDQAVAGSNRVQNCLLALSRVRYLEYAETLQRHFDSIV